MIKKDLWKLIDGELGAEFERKTSLKHAALRVHSLFTDNREFRVSNYLESEESWKAYLAYYLPLNFFKVINILQSHHKKIAVQKSLRILDFGCGPATATFAFLSYLKDLKIESNVEVCLVDNQKKILTKSEKLVKTFADQNQLKVTVKSFIEIPKDEDYDFIFAINVMNELKQDISNVLWSSLKMDGYLLIIEPSHRVSSQRLIRNRERILKNNDSHMIGPCMHHQKCPVYRSKNWCHFSLSHRDDRLKSISIKWYKDPRSWLKFSYLFFKKSDSDRKDSTNQLRAIGDLHPIGRGKEFSKTERSIFKHGNLSLREGSTLAIDLCSPNEKRVYTLNNHEKKEFGEKLNRGCIVEIDMSQIQKVIPFRFEKK